MRIRKKYQVIPTNAKLENGYSTSDKNGYVCEYINSLNEYSTEEVRIGTWLGKPLYRRVIIGNKNTETADIILSYIDNIINCTGMYRYTSGNYTNYRLTIPNANPSIPAYCSFDNNSKTFSFITTNSTTPVNYTIIIEYTKTTD